MRRGHPRISGGRLPVAGAGAAVVAFACSWLLAGALPLGCTRSRPATPNEKRPAFDCAGRGAQFVRTSGDIQDGVELTCTGATPFIRRWVSRLTNEDRRESSHSLTPWQFEAVWLQVSSTNWQRQRTCSREADNKETKPEAAQTTMTAFAVRHGMMGLQVQCAGKAWPRAFTQLYEVLTRAGRNYAPWPVRRIPR